MGHLSKQLFPSGVELLPDLNRAYADEWFGHYNYFFVSTMVRGPSAASVADLLRRKSDDCFRRAQRLAARIAELGGTPVPKLTDLVDHATDKPFKLPEDLTDVPGLLAAVLDAERTSIRTYHGLQGAASGRDPLTTALVLDLLAEAVHGEQELEVLLARPAPEKTGT